MCVREELNEADSSLLSHFHLIRGRHNKGAARVEMQGAAIAAATGAAAGAAAAAGTEEREEEQLRSEL